MLSKTPLAYFYLSILYVYMRKVTVYSGRQLYLRNRDISSTFDAKRVIFKILSVLFYDYGDIKSIYHIKDKRLTVCDKESLLFILI